MRAVRARELLRDQLPSQRAEQGPSPGVLCLKEAEGSWGRGWWKHGQGREV